MKARFLAENPDEIIFTMKITMSAKQWCVLRDRLEEARSKGISSSEVATLSQRITDLLADARKTFWRDDPETSQ